MNNQNYYPNVLPGSPTTPASPNSHYSLGLSQSSPTPILARSAAPTTDEESLIQQSPVHRVSLSGAMSTAGSAAFSIASSVISLFPMSSFHIAKGREDDLEEGSPAGKSAGSLHFQRRKSHFF